MEPHAPGGRTSLLHPFPAGQNDRHSPNSQQQRQSHKRGDSFRRNDHHHVHHFHDRRAHLHARLRADGQAVE